jgi:serine/threonine protein kinase
MLSSKVNTTAYEDMVSQSWAIIYSLSSFSVRVTGTFGQVLECWDLENQEAVAIKIVRSLQKYREAAMIEIDVLQRLGKHDFTGSR